MGFDTCFFFFFLLWKEISCTCKNILFDWFRPHRHICFFFFFFFFLCDIGTVFKSRGKSSQNRLAPDKQREMLKASYTRSHGKDIFKHTRFHNSCLVVKIDWLCCPVDFLLILSMHLQYRNKSLSKDRLEKKLKK